MTLLLLFGALGLMLLPALGWKVGSRLPPDEWVRFCTIAVLGGAVILEIALVLCAVPALARLPGVGSWFGSHHERHFFPGGTPVGWLSLAGAVYFPVGGWKGWLRARRQQASSWVEPGLGRRIAREGFELVVLPTSEIVAIAVPGPPPQVVISNGLLGALTTDEVRVVVDHEAAHLRSRHSRYLLFAEALCQAFWVFPPIRRSVATLRVALECSADQAAAGSAGDRRAIRGALRSLTETGAQVGVPAFAMPNTVLARLEVLENVAANHAPGRLRFAMYVGLVGLALLSIFTVVLWLQAA